ncbi:hypothetical protein N9Z02_02205 [Akkermansiaceae bacterium]|nr:hypothetical protein [Akkermansiaceae bacterium]
MSSPYSAEELTDILQRALDALESGRRGHIYRRSRETGEEEPFHLKRDLEKLDACCPDFDIIKEATYWDTILDCLETALDNPLATYKKPEKPICSHDEALNHEMFSFSVQLGDFTRPIYTKFCLKEQSDGTWYVSIDCHT